MSCPGIMVTAAAWLLIDFDQPDLKLLKNFDWLGLALMAVMLGACEYVLEEGPSDDWFQDELILRWRSSAPSPASASSGGRSPPNEPIVELRAFADRNFAAGCAFSLIMGVGLYGLDLSLPGLSRPACAATRRCRSARPCSSPAPACSSWRRLPAG